MSPCLRPRFPGSPATENTVCGWPQPSVGPLWSREGSGGSSCLSADVLQFTFCFYSPGWGAFTSIHLPWGWAQRGQRSLFTGGEAETLGLVSTRVWIPRTLGSGERPPGQ